MLVKLSYNEHKAKANLWCMSSLHQRISKVRRSNGLSQANLAERLGVTRTACSHWETGRAKPSTKHIEKIAKLLSVDAHWLISGQKPRRSSMAPSASKLSSNQPESIAFEPVQPYGSKFDKDTQKVAAKYFALNRSHRKLIRDLIQALHATNSAS